MVIVDNNVDELLTGINDMHRRKVDKVVKVDEKMDIRTKKEKTTLMLTSYPRVYLFIFMTTMSTICQRYVFLSVNFSSTMCQHVNKHKGV